jgi:hypothetical protein
VAPLHGDVDRRGPTEELRPDQEDEDTGQQQGTQDLEA